MKDITGYVVIEYNQASGFPSAASEEIYLDRDEAEEELAKLHTATVAFGRRERYAIGTIYIEED